MYRSTSRRASAAVLGALLTGIAGRGGAPSEDEPAAPGTTGSGVESTSGAPGAS